MELSPEVSARVMQFLNGMDNLLSNSRLQHIVVDRALEDLEFASRGLNPDMLSNSQLRLEYERELVGRQSDKDLFDKRLDRSGMNCPGKGAALYVNALERELR
jgi:hypothetical protein